MPFFYLHRSDRRIVLTLLCLGIVVAALLWLTDDNPSSHTSSLTSQATTPVASASGLTPHADSPGHLVPRTSYPAPRDLTPHPFDPNTADSAELTSLGLQRWQVHNILKYRRAGGIYRRPQDFARLYGLTVGEYQRLEPYIRISDDYRPASTLVSHERTSAPSYPRTPESYTSQATTPGASTSGLAPHKLAPGETIVLNAADTTELRRVPGIGTYFAKQIVNYGRRLGGYVSVDQLDEITDFPSSAKAYLVVSHPQPHRLNINTLSLDELRRHPYINYYQARAIVEYRRLHGAITSLQQLATLRDFPPEAISRLEPYVVY